MPHLGVAVRRPPGPRDTTRAHQAGGRALPSEDREHAAGNRPDGDLEAENQAKGTEKEQNWRRGRDARGDLPKDGADGAHVARKAAAAGMRHPGVAVRRRPGPRHTTPQQSDGGRAIPADICLRRQPNMAR